MNGVESSPLHRLVLSRPVILHGCLFIVFYALLSTALYGLRYFGLINDGDRFSIHINVGFGFGEGGHPGEQRGEGSAAKDSDGAGIDMDRYRNEVDDCVSPLDGARANNRHAVRALALDVAVRDWVASV
jgi:hypothetical protein